MPAATSSTCRSRISTCSAATAARAKASTLDRLGGEAWQRRKARMKERIREIAGELIKTAAAARHAPRCDAEPDTSYPQFVDRFPYEETDDQDRAIGDVLERSRGGQADGPAGLRRCRLRQDRGRAARRLRRGDGRQAGRAGLPDHAARAPALQELRRALHGFPIKVGRLSRLVPAAEAKETKEGLADGKSTSSSARTRSWPRASSSSSSAWSSSMRSSTSESPTRRG